LNYYTGTIIEVKSSQVDIGSICGGGRYDNLTGIFGMPGISGVGISFGADRIYDVMIQLNLFPEEIVSVTQIMIVNFGEKEQLHCLQLLNRLRKASIRAEIYPDPVKLKKQLVYANNRKIPFVLLVGEQEIESGRYTLKNMLTGEQEVISASEIVSRFTHNNKS
jgi:histidyl-tRNA synthetase